MYCLVECRKDELFYGRGCRCHERGRDHIAFLGFIKEVFGRVKRRVSVIHMEHGVVFPSCNRISQKIYRSGRGLLFRAESLGSHDLAGRSVLIIMNDQLEILPD